MKINFNAVIAVAISILMAYGLYSIESNENRVMVAVGSFILFSASLVLMVGINFDMPRTGVNLRVVSGIFFVAALLSSLLFSFVGVTTTSYVVTNGIMLMLFLLVARTIFSTRQ